MSVNLAKIVTYLLSFFILVAVAGETVGEVIASNFKCELCKTGPVPDFDNTPEGGELPQEQENEEDSKENEHEVNGLTAYFTLSIPLSLTSFTFYKECNLTAVVVSISTPPPEVV